jgi:integrase
MLETGMRCDEVYRIRRSEVFLSKNYLQVTKGKTAATVRRVYLSDKAKDVLRYRLKKFKGENLFPQNDIDDGAPTKMLSRVHGEPRRSDSISGFTTADILSPLVCSNAARSIW